MSYCVSPCSVSLCLRSFVFVSHQQCVVFLHVRYHCQGRSFSPCFCACLVSVPCVFMSHGQRICLQIEDLSDEAYILRHKYCESEERNRLFNFVQYPPTRRNRGPHQVGGQALDCSHQDLTRPTTPNLPVSMGTQASLDGGDFGGEDSMDVPVQHFSASVPHTPSGGTPVPHFSLGPTEDESLALNASGGGAHGLGMPRRGSMSASQRERLSLGSSVEDSDWDSHRPSSVLPWPPRQFPLTDEEVSKLFVEETAHREVKAQCTLRSVSGIGALRPHPVEGSSQAGSSVSGSLPASPMPSSSSASAAGDYDAADPEWVAEAETSKKMASQHKAIKR